VLLVKNWIGNGSWDFPGGGIHRGESLIQGVSRELYEETGILISAEAWEFITQLQIHQTTFAYLKARSQSGKILKQRTEIIDAQWFDLRALPTKLHKSAVQLLPLGQD
jgi:8-oxo-dGTP pyrophosphatase MutT (NUDIX family)